MAPSRSSAPPFAPRIVSGVAVLLVVLAVGVLLVVVPRLGAVQATTGDAAPSDGLPEIVERSIAHHGGALYEASEVSMTITSLSGSFDLVVRQDGGSYRYVVEGETRDGVLRRVESTNDGVRLWLDGVEQEVAPEDVQRWRDFASARVYFPFLPHRLGDPSARVTDLGIETWGERELHKVKVTFAAGSSTDAEDEYLYWFDPETGRLEQLAYSFETGDGGLRFRRATDFHRVGGMLFSDQENLGMAGHGLSVDSLNPAFVEEKLEPVSTITLSAIEVEPLGDGAE